MPIHTSWIPMIEAMRKEYSEGKERCYDTSDGKKICASAKAWSVFFAKVNKDYGSGAESKPRTRTVHESEKKEEEFTEVSEVAADIFIDWYFDKILKEEKKNVK